MMYREKLMRAVARELWINFTRLQMSFASESAGKKAVSEGVVDEKIRLPVNGTLPSRGNVPWCESWLTGHQSKSAVLLGFSAIWCASCVPDSTVNVRSRM